MNQTHIFRAIFFAVIFICLTAINTLLAQTDSVFTVKLNQFSKDERFDKFKLTLALFLTQNDTIYSFDYEGLKKAQPLIIRRPSGYEKYAYGYLFFSGIPTKNPGYLTVLVCNPYHKHPHLYIDYNNDLDFNNDPRYTLPFFDEPPLSIELGNKDYPLGKTKVLLTRNKLFGNLYDFKKYMDEYYASIYPDRKFIGIEYTYREQRLQARSGIVKLPDDSFKIALYDANCNGLYNDSDTDKVMVINTKDTVFDATNPLGTFTLNKPGQPMYFEKNGKFFEILHASLTGDSVQIKLTDHNPDLGKIKWGKKVPNIKFTLAKYNKFLKLKKLKKQNVYIYLANTSSRNFASDTLMLRQIAQLDTNNLKVICVLYVNKTYQLKMFDMDAEANYYVALGTKEIAKKLGISSIPQSIWLCKKRRVIKYGIKPSEFVRTYLKYKK